MLQAGQALFVGAIRFAIRQVQALQRPAHVRIDRQGMTAQAVLHRVGNDEWRGALKALQFLLGLLHPLLEQTVQIERVGRLEQFLKQADEAVGTNLGIGQDA